MKKSVVIALSMQIFLGVGSFWGCFQKGDPSSAGANDPKRRLTDYISKSFSVGRPEDRSHLMEYLTGEARKRLEAWSDEQFSSAFIDSKRQFIKLLFQDIKEISPAEVSITYELVYRDKGKGHDVKVTNKKLCQMVLERGSWLISDVRTIKELVEYQNEMSLP